MSAFLIEPHVNSRTVQNAQNLQTFKKFLQKVFYNVFLFVYLFVLFLIKMNLHYTTIYYMIVTEGAKIMLQGCQTLSSGKMTSAQ